MSAWKEKKVTIGLGTIATVLLFAFTFREEIPETFHDVTGHALENRVELIAGSLEQTQKSMSEIVIENNLSKLNEELRKLTESIRHHGDDGYNVTRKKEVEEEIRFWLRKRDCLREPDLC